MSDALKARILASRSKTHARLLPMWNAWRIHRPNHEWSDEALELAIHILQRREKGYKHARHSPSTANHCIRRSVLQYLGHKGEEVKDANTLGKFDGGNFGHLKWQMYFFDMGLLRSAEVPALDGELRSAGTCDGIIDIPLEGWDKTMTREEVRALCESGDVPVWTGTLEIKEMFSRRWANNRMTVEPKTRWQGELYTMMNEHRFPDLDGSLFWFENKDTNEIIEHDVGPDQLLRKRIVEFYGLANDLIDAGKLPERPYKNSDYECKYCPQFDRCNRLERKGKTEIKAAKGLTHGDFTNE